MKPLPPLGVLLMVLACPLPAVPQTREHSKKVSSSTKKSADPAMEALEAQYAAGRVSDLLTGLARYADELTALRKTLLTDGDTAGAARVQLELDRVLPVIAPVTSAPAPPPDGDGDEFSLFNEPAAPAPAPPVLPAGAATPEDLESLLRVLKPVPAPSGAAVSKPAGGKSARRLLKMADARLAAGFSGDPGPLYWREPGRRAVWTPGGLPVTSCLVVLRYACDEKSGGRLSVAVGTTRVEVDVPSTGGWTRYRDLTIGPLSVSDSEAALALEVASLKTGAAALMELKAVMLISSGP